VPLLTIPSSDTALTEFNTCHTPGGSPAGGQFCSDTEAGTSYARPKVLQVRSIEEAIRLIGEGHSVELPDTRAVNTLIAKLAAMAQDAVSKGTKAPFYNLCNVSVAGTNLFCAEKLRTHEHPEGIPRLNMPQFGGEARPGSLADKLPKDRKGVVDGADAFLAHLQALGIKTSKGDEVAAKLRATQRELDGANVAQMMTSKTFNPRKKSIFVSRDHYVIDGHHRWAAAVGLDAADNVLNEIQMQVIRVDAPISEILHLANKWTKQFGILPRGV
jgi:hypothetical protein